MWAAVIIIGVLLELSNCINVTVQGEWQSELGWQILCNWSVPVDDRLQSVRLYRDDQQFMIYRPETHGLTKGEVFRNPEYFMKIDCAQNERKSYDGVCSILIEPFQPLVDDIKIGCEVSGERPWFKMVTKDFIAEAFVPPTDALFTNIKRSNFPPLVQLNCSSAGLPPPSLTWTVGENQHQVPSDFSSKIWNVTTKLWHVWSSLNYTPQFDGVVRVNCTPEVKKAGRTARGEPALYNSSLRLTGYALAVAALQTLLLLAR